MEGFAEVAVFGAGQSSHSEEADDSGEFGGGDGRNASPEVTGADVLVLELFEHGIAEASAAWWAGQGYEGENEAEEAEGDQKADWLAAIDADDDLDDADGERGEGEHQGEHDGFAGLRV